MLGVFRTQKRGRAELHRTVAHDVQHSNSDIIEVVIVISQ